MLKSFGSLFTIVVILNVLISCGERMTKEQLFALAEKYENEENYEDAIKTYEKLIKNYPKAEKADQAQYKIALIYSNNLNDFSKSIKIYEKLIGKYPDSKFAAQSLFMIGFIYANNLNDIEKAEEYYKEFLEKYPEDELVNSVKWELEHLGQDINEIDFLNQQPVNEADTVKAEQTAQ